MLRSVKNPARALVAAALLLLGSAPATVLAVSPMQPGLWELRAATTLNKQSQTPEGSRECLSQADIDHATKTLPKPDQNCQLSNITTNGKRVSYDINCASNDISYAGHMELVMGSQSYDGMADFKLNSPGKSETPMTVIVNARRVGDCTK